VRRIIAQAPAFLNPGASLLIEIDPRQVETLLLNVGPRFFEAPGEVASDLSHVPRVVIFFKSDKTSDAGTLHEPKRD
jgi:hypothetical protein